jgi:hypothetical protein
LVSFLYLFFSKYQILKERVRRQIDDDILMVVAANRPTSSSAASAASQRGFNF